MGEQKTQLICAHVYKEKAGVSNSLLLYPPEEMKTDK